MSTERHKRIRLGLLILILVGGSSAHAFSRPKNSWFTVGSSYTLYNDVKLSDGEPETLTESLDVELSIKFYNSYYLSLVTSQTTNQARTGYGVGARVDFPGIFFFNARNRLKTSKNYPLNFSAFINTQLVDSTEGARTGKSIATRYGLTSEIFLFNKYTFLQLDFSVYNLAGNAYLTYGGGMGFEF